MVQLAFHRKIALLVLALALLLPWSAQARPLGNSPAEPLAGLLACLTDWITVWFGDVGCSWGPNGLCRGTNWSQPPTPTDHLDVGCSMDPGGRCKATLTDQIDVGCSWDPGGGCHDTPTADVGCSLDPNGRSCHD
jgi:hypothetical protein